MVFVTNKQKGIRFWMPFDENSLEFLVPEVGKRHSGLSPKASLPRYIS